MGWMVIISTDQLRDAKLFFLSQISSHFLCMPDHNLFKSLISKISTNYFQILLLTYKLIYLNLDRYQLLSSVSPRLLGPQLPQSSQYRD